MITDFLAETKVFSSSVPWKNPQGGGFLGFVDLDFKNDLRGDSMVLVVIFGLSSRISSIHLMSNVFGLNVPFQDSKM